MSALRVRVAPRGALLLAWATALATAIPARADNTLPAPAPRPSLKRAVTPDDILAMRRMGGYRRGLVVSPDRAAAAVHISEITPDSAGYAYAWHRIALDGSGAVARMGHGGEPVQRPGASGTINGHPEDPVGKWSPDGRAFAFLAQHDGILQLWLAEPGRDDAVRLVAAEDDIDTFEWSTDSTAMFLTFDSTRRRVREARARAAQEGFRLDEDVDPLFALAPTSPKQASDTVWRADVRQRSYRRASEEETRLHADLKAGELVPGRPQAQLVARLVGNGPLAWAEAPEANRQGAEPPLRVMARTDSAQETPLACTAPECFGQIERLWWNAPNEVMFVRREGHARSLRGFYLWRLSQPGVRRLLATEDTILDCSLIATLKLACFRERPEQPRQLVLFDLARDETRILFDPNPEFRNFEFTRLEKLEVTDEQGHESFAHLVYPASYEPGRSYPLVIVQYRSNGFLTGGTGDEYPIHAFAQHGFFVLSVDRPEPRELLAYLPPKEVQIRTERDHSEQTMKQTALERLIDRVVARGLVDPGRVGITGLSDGAETVFWGLIHSSRFACAAVSSPPTDPIAFDLQSTAIRRQLTENGLLRPDDAREPFGSAWWRRSSASFHPERFSVPLLMNLAESEVLAAAPLHARLTDGGLPVETYIYPGQFHIKLRPSHRRAIYERNLDWFDFWLREYEDPDPAKATQYQRWRQLRQQREMTSKSMPAPSGAHRAPLAARENSR